jgi:predicted RNase H-like HicB family nuclease
MSQIRLYITILYEEGDDGWIVSSIPEVPGVLSQAEPRGRPAKWH